MIRILGLRAINALVWTASALQRIVPCQLLFESADFLLQRVHGAFASMLLFAIESLVWSGSVVTPVTFSLGSHHVVSDDVL